jgi:hypothetical protein
MRFSEVSVRSFVLILLTAALFTPTLWAGEARLSWVPPTEREDGSPIGEALTYRVLWGQDSRQYDHSEMVSETEYTVADLGPGVWYFAVTAIDAGGLESDYSAEASKTFEASPPLPPSGLTVQQGAQAAYGLVQSTDRFALVPVGIVPAGTECDPAQQIRDSNGVRAYVVPRSAVEWAGSVRPRVVVAQCG